MTSSERAQWPHYVGIALVASAILAYEIVLMRTFAIESYATFGAMVISVAMLGFGMGGTLMTVMRDFVLRHKDRLLYGSALLFVPLVVIAHFLQQQVPFVPGKMLGEPSHAWWIAAYYGIAFVPLFFASFFVGLTLVGYARDIHKLYFADLAASGVGAFVVLGLLYVIHPKWLILMPVVPAAVAAVVVAKKPWQAVVATVVGLICVATVLAKGEVRFNEYKGILGALRTVEVSGAKVIDERYGPMGFIQVVSTSSGRTAPGLSLGTPVEAQVPAQHALFVDGEKIGSLARKLEGKDGLYLEYLVSSLPYVLTPKPRTLVLGVAGGEAMVEALYHGAPRVMGVEANPQFIDLLRTYSEYNGHLLKKKGVEVTVGEGRAIAEKHSGEFDLVMLRGLDASGLSASSTPGVSENYSVTVEAFESYFHALAPNGMLAITMRMSPPPWKAIRLLPTAAEALKRAGYDQRETRVVFIRNVMYALCLVKPDGFTETDTAKIRKWALSRSFDISIMTGLKPAETNQFTELIEDTYYRIGMAVLTSDGKKALDEYMFDIRATTDDRPYFGAVVRSNSLKGIQEYRLKSQLAAASIGGSPDSVPDGDSGPGDIPDGDTGPGDIPDGDEADTSTPAPKSEETDEDDELAPTDSIFDEIRQMPVELWGVYLQWATLIQALLFSLLVIVVPLFGRRHGIQKVPGKVRTVVFFACLGIGFMFAEIVAIRKLTLFLANPIFATTLVLAAILVFTGIGSLVSARLKTRPVRAIRIAAIGIVVSILVWTIALDPLMRSLLGLSTFLRVLLSIVFIAPLAFFLGFPFPTAMSVLDSDSARQPLVPWAWAINGAMGVVATVAAAVLSTALGFRVVMLIAAGLYILAWLTFPGGLKDNPARESEPLW